MERGGVYVNRYFIPKRIEMFIDGKNSIIMAPNQEKTGGKYSMEIHSTLVDMVCVFIICTIRFFQKIFE